MRPKISFLAPELIEKIVAESIAILERVGVEIDNPDLVSILADNGARVDEQAGRVYFPETVIRSALDTAPAGFKLYDVSGNQTHDFSGDNIHFTPGSSALTILDHKTQEIRPPSSVDYVDFVKLVSGLDNIASQSTAFVPADVPEQVSDSYRLFLSLLYGKKPVITGAFSIDAFEIMHDLQLIVRGSQNALDEKPLTVFTCCPTSPLKWSSVSSQNLVDCVSNAIPVEIVAMPMTGFISPVTLIGTVIQHTAELLSGLVISQVVQPGARLLWGGSPTAFDIRFETTPMGAVETMMIDCANCEVGKHLGLPTQAYISLSDAKLLDAQAGLETGMGATLAALSGINNISGPGMLDFENCQSLEKLVLDNEIAGMALRLADGMTPRDDFPIVPLMEELLAEKHLLIADHTLANLRREHYYPGPVIDRANRSRWTGEGSTSLEDRAHGEVERIISEYKPSSLPVSIKNDLIDRMRSTAGKYGLRELPTRH